MNTFMIIDDDVNVIKMLSNIIKKNDLGKIVEELDSSKHAINEILFYNPDIVLIDYLLPPIDGVEVVQSIREEGYKGKVIMISQVEDEYMISKAYNVGVLFFITKPINSIEVINVIKTVSHSIELENSLSMIKYALSNVNNNQPVTKQEHASDSIESILTDLGIIAEPGSHDLIKIINKIYSYRKIDPMSTYKLHDIYEEVIEDSNLSFNKVPIKDIKSLEQRIRRIIQKSLANIAQIGQEDFYNPKFIEYSTLLFDLKHIKQEIRYLENPSQDRGRVNIKKFIEGTITKIK